MSKKSPIEIFSEWVDLGKDDGMEKNHSKSVSVMLNKVLKNLKTFTFLDAGCGNGWVVRKVSKLKNCVGSIGVDGSLKMIKKARNLDSINNYECAELSTWKPNKKIDVVALDKDENLKAEKLLFDKNENGIFELTLYEHVLEGREIIVYEFDEDEDGKAESLGLDFDKDGKIDKVLPNRQG